MSDDESKPNGAAMKIIAGVMSSLVVGVLGGGAVMGNDTTAQEAQVASSIRQDAKLETILGVVHETHSAVGILKANMINLEKNQERQDQRMNERMLTLENKVAKIEP
jgi:hypothetical protein